MAVKSPAELKAQVQILFPDNTVGDISPEDSRTQFTDQVDSWDALKVNESEVDVAKFNANKIQGNNVEDQTPNDGEMLIWNNDESQWEPSSPFTATGYISYVDNAIVTPISTINTPELVDQATFNPVELDNFDSPVNGRLRYTGTDTFTFKIRANICMYAESNDRHMTAYIGLNGSVINASKSSTTCKADECDTIPIDHRISLSQNDYLEFFVENNENTDDITCVICRLIVELR
jgi:hypothetical protein